jgi:hypothetical protein
MNPDLAQQALRKEKSVRNWDIEDIVRREREVDAYSEDKDSRGGRRSTAWSALPVFEDSHRCSHRSRI